MQADHPEDNYQSEETDTGFYRTISNFTNIEKCAECVGKIK